MPKLTIDGIQIEVPEGSTILDASLKLGIEIPTLCFMQGFEPATSCMICVVKDTCTGILYPACSAPAENGMVIDTTCKEVREARKEALQLLLSEHIGDCEAPCTRSCPAHVNLPLMVRQIAKGDIMRAAATLLEHIPFPSIIGRICTAPCEKACRRRLYDSPVPLKSLAFYAADAALYSTDQHTPSKKPQTEKRVAIVGSELSGLTAAYFLLLQGHKCYIFNKGDNPGSMLRSELSKHKLPQNLLDLEIKKLYNLGAEFRMNIDIGCDISIEALRDEYDAVVLTHKKPNPEPLKPGIWNTARHAVRQKGTAAHVIARSRAVALSVDEYLTGGNTGMPRKRFDSRLGRLKEGEMEEFLKTAENTASSSAEHHDVVLQAGRCLHCDCFKAIECKLRAYADEYGAKQHRYRGETRVSIRRIIQHPDIIYEPGKCIKCGRCVKITQAKKEEFGLTFVGRGFDVLVEVPFNAGIEKGLLKTAFDCAKACPTGALCLKKDED